MLQESNESRLFCRANMSDLINHIQHQRPFENDIDNLKEPIILYGDHENIVQTLVEKYSLLVPKIVGEADIDARTTKVSASKLPTRFFFDTDREVQVPVFLITASYRFEGDPKFFDLRPNEYRLSYPMAKIGTSSITFSWIQHEQNLDLSGVPNAAKQSLEEIEWWLSRLRSLANEYNAWLKKSALTYLNNSRNRLWQIKEQLAILGKKVFELSEAKVAVVQQSKHLLLGVPSIQLEPTTFSFPHKLTRLF